MTVSVKHVPPSGKITGTDWASEHILTGTPDKYLGFDSDGIITELDGGSATVAWGGVTGSLSSQADLQAALDAKADTSHTHIIGDVTGLQAALDGKQAAGSYAASVHTHAISDVTGLQTALDGKQAAGSYQASDAELTAIAGLTSAANKLPYFTGSGTAALADLTAAGRALIDDADAAAQRTTLGLAIGTDVQAFNQKLADIAGASFAQGDVLYHNGTNLVRLAAGTSGQFLKTNGAGANPAWANAETPLVPAGAITKPSTSQFTLVQGVVASSAMSNVSRGVQLAIAGAAASDRNALLEVTPGASSWTMTALLVPNAWWRNYLTFGLYAKDSGTGKIHAFCQAYNGAVDARQMRWTNITTFSASTEYSSFSVQGPIWIKLQLDATNLTFSLSQDGETWLQVAQVAKAAFLASIDRAGVWFGTNQQSTGGYPQNVTEYLTVMSFSLT